MPCIRCQIMAKRDKVDKNGLELVSEFVIANSSWSRHIHRTYRCQTCGYEWDEHDQWDAGTGSDYAFNMVKPEQEESDHV